MKVSSCPNEHGKPIDDRETAAEPVVLKLELLVSASDTDADLPSSHYERSNIIFVRENQEIARFVDAEEGWKERPPRLGENVAMAADGCTVVAKANGVLYVNSGRVWVEKALVVRGDVDFSVGNIDFAQDVIITGGILDLFKVSSGGTIKVGKAAEAAEVKAAKSLIVRGGIVGKEKGRYFAGEDVRAGTSATPLSRRARMYWPSRRWPIAA